MIARRGRPRKKRKNKSVVRNIYLELLHVLVNQTYVGFVAAWAGISWVQSGKVPATARPKKQASNCGQKKGGGTFMGRLELVHALAKARHPQLSGHGSTLASTGNEELRSQRLFKAFFIARCLQGLSQCLRHDGSVWISCILVWIGGMDRPVGSWINPGMSKT